MNGRENTSGTMGFKGDNIMGTKQSTAQETFIDPICGMTVKPETAAAKYEAETGETVYFCSAGL